MAKKQLSTVLRRIVADHEKTGDISIVFVSDDEIRSAHAEYFDDDTPTDVITFPLATEDDARAEPDAELGEIWVSIDTARRVAQKRQLRFDRELALYAVHGVLHLVGYDDRDPTSRRKMRRAETRYLTDWPRAAD
jgi:probable rRNA maturation factor